MSTGTAAAVASGVAGAIPRDELHAVIRRLSQKQQYDSTRRIPGSKGAQTMKKRIGRIAL